MSNLSVQDIGKFLLLQEKYKDYLIENGIDEKDNFYFFKECANSNSKLLKIMDDCQKALYKYRYPMSEEDIEVMKKFQKLFNDGLKTLKEISETFEIVVNEK